ncbi:MAG: CZB domain-containing protein [Alphaproteobacteria bacterium]|nr:CZB domain-containing protein [Alphaproteobacteria bacterium]
MKFGEAINVHRGWKLKLTSYLKKPDGSLKADVVSCDDKCEMGQWIHSAEAAKFSSTPEFVTMKTEHARFHKAAGNIIRKVDSGQDITEDLALGSDSEFGVASSTVVAAIMAMMKKMSK